MVVRWLEVFEHVDSHPFEKLQRSVLYFVVVRKDLVKKGGQCLLMDKMINITIDVLLLGCLYNTSI